MADYAMYQDNVILNVIVAESKEIAEEVTGMKAIETKGSPWIGWTLVDSEWIAPVVPMAIDSEQQEEITIQEA